jgi:hypothetical protein
MNEYIAGSPESKQASSGDFTILSDRDVDEWFAAEASDEACPCPLCRSQNVARERGRSPP